MGDDENNIKVQIGKMNTIYADYNQYKLYIPFIKNYLYEYIFHISKDFIIKIKSRGRDNSINYEYYHITYMNKNSISINECSSIITILDMYNYFDFRSEYMNVSYDSLLDRNDIIEMSCILSRNICNLFFKFYKLRHKISYYGTIKDFI